MSLMDMDGIYKNAQLVATDEPYLRPLSDEQLVFYNLDVNTAVLTFQVKRDIYPLQISSLNSDIDVFLKSENGSHTSLVEPRFIDPLNGIVRFVVDSGFLSAATNTWVKGQARLRAVGRKDTVILNEFSFYVKDALINKIGADIKVRYIRQIDQLIEETQKRVNEAILGISNVESAKVSFDSFISKQKTDLENIITDTESKMKKLADSTQIAVDDQLNRFRSEANAIKVDLQSETAGAVTKPDLDSTLSNYVTTTDFNNALDNKADKGEITPSNLPDNFNELINQAVSDLMIMVNCMKLIIQTYRQWTSLINLDIFMRLVHFILLTGMTQRVCCKS